jgi:protein SCO1/2
VTLKDRLGRYVPRDVALTDHRGRAVTLGDFLDGRRPVLLTLNYYRCTTLCTVQLTELTKGLKGLEWSPGEKFRLVTVSIDPREDAELARRKRASYLQLYGRGEVDWTFLVGQEKDLERLAEAVGFAYTYDAKADQFIHVPAIFFLSPQGRLSRFLHGLRYPTQSLRFALMEASEGRIGSFKDRVFMSCFHFDPEDGTYSAQAFGIMRLAGIAVALLLGLLLTFLWLMDRLVWRKRHG